MKYRLMDLLACPICKHFPLQLTVIKSRKVERSTDEKKPLCELYCAYKNSNIKDIQNPPCDECITYEIEEGVLYCPSCGRWYPIIDDIPRMLPDNLRKKEDDINFLNRNKDKLPSDIIKKGLPFNLS
ncbi:Trm112 family protein [Acidianus sulfidivorans JP7]|uniref:Trm112 family protein n=1 Tax=Acidianus sulfidivorans JP7 TaxID=619593 RepID=A0A2U9IMM9_9CREN|nr:Trm112 family protein [Acidianus sulfidivorans]AWR97319.1 Trm112 family protein [Acidianus sulfidivorans JP7]